MKDRNDNFEQLSADRKQSIAEGRNPEWLTTPSYQTLLNGYLTEEDPDLDSTFKRISKVLAKHAPHPEYAEYAETFYNLLWEGDLACSTPVLSNCGTNKGSIVSCSGGTIEDSVKGFYDATGECAVLTKEGFGTSSYLGDIRPRGAQIASGGTASGVLPVIKGLIQMSRDISQGVRRGAHASYLPIDHDDFWEVLQYLNHHSEDFNIGWNISNEFLSRLENKDSEASDRFAAALKVKLVRGKGYFFLVDRANEKLPQFMKDMGLRIKGSNLCTEITLPSNDLLSFSCIISSVNLANYDKGTFYKVVFDSFIFLDCVVSEFLESKKGTKGLEKVLAYTSKFRSVGLGALGFHTLLQKRNIPMGSMDAHLLNGEIFKTLQEASKDASEYLGKELGVPKDLVSINRRNSHLNAIAPNTSSAAIVGGVSQGIEPIYANAFVQPMAGGDIIRVNPQLIDIMKEKDIYNQDTIDDIIENAGSVKHVDWLDDLQKEVFLTAGEIPASTLVRLANARGRYIDQAQSLNLFFTHDTPEEEVLQAHKEALLSPHIKSLYYLRSTNSNRASSGDCELCES